MASLINKARKPKFEVHLRIYDLNNVPLVSGVSLIKWGLPHSLHGEHKGRTSKCAIANHRVEYNYSKVIPVRINIDRNNNLTECPIEFEVLQEFSSGTLGAAVGARDEKITLGTVRLNLSEYVEESEAILRDGIGAGNYTRSITTGSTGLAGLEKGHSRKRSSGLGSETEDISPRSSRHGMEESLTTTHGVEVEEGVIRRHLMQDSKINSTLKIGILMVQIDGDRNYVAPALKTAPVFGGIAGIMAGDPLSDPVGEPSADALAGPVPSSLMSKARDNASEVQDMYRRSLAASWACQPGELPADQCIEDIFSGGDGFKTGSSRRSHDALDPSAAQRNGRPGRYNRHSKPVSAAGSGISSGSASDSYSAWPREESGSTSENEDNMGTLRPRDVARMRAHFRRHSGASDRSATTVRDHTHESSRGIGLERDSSHRDLSLLRAQQQQASQSQQAGHSPKRPVSRSRSDSMGSHVTATTAGSDRLGRGREGFRAVKEVDESDMRDDLMAWSIGARSSAVA